MRPENKQRLVGVIVLAAFIALLIPFLFTSGVKKRHALEEASDTTNVANQTVAVNPTIENSQVPTNNEQQATVAQEPTKDLPDSLQQQSVPLIAQSLTILPAQEQADKPNGTPESNQVLPAAPQPRGSELVTQAALPQPATSTSLPATNATDVNSQAVVSTTEATTASVEPVKSKVVAKKTKKKAIKAKTSIASKTKSGAKVFWSVRVGTYSDQARVQKMVEKLRANGFRVFLQKILTTKGPMVRVLVGHEVCKDKAIKIAEKLKTNLKINGYLVSNKK